jgi:hypothetical protein
MMPPSITYLRTTATIAVLIAVAIFAWQVSSPVATILRDYHVHLVATTLHPAAPKVIHVPPKVAAVTCRP